MASRSRLRDKEATQHKILQAFERLIVRDGLSSVGINKLAREAGVHVIGVGIGSDAKYVAKTFDDHVHVEKVAEMPGALIRKLNEIVDTRRIKVSGRNRRIATA